MNEKYLREIDVVKKFSDKLKKYRIRKQINQNSN